MKHFLMMLFGASLLALPAQAQMNPAATLSEANLARVSDHVWAITGYPNVGIVVGSKGTLVIDTGLGPRNGALLAKVALGLSPKAQTLYLTTTHFHPEHAAGESGFPAGTVTIRPRAQQAELDADGQRTIELFASRGELYRDLLAGATVKPARVLFEQNYDLDLGGVTVRLFWFGPAHTRGDELVMIQTDSVLFPGDVVQNKLSPNISCAECSPRSWLAVLDQVAMLRPAKIVPDHGEQGGNGLIAQEQAFLRDLQSRVLALKAEGKSAADAAKQIAAEFQAKYADWTGLGNLRQSVSRAYADTGN